MSEPIEQEDPVSELLVVALTHWARFDAYCKAGFERTEAMELLLAFIASENDR